MPRLRTASRSSVVGAPQDRTGTITPDVDIVGGAVESVDSVSLELD